MSREVRRVPATWEHPKDERGRYIPLFEGCYDYAAEAWREGREKWSDGLHRGGVRWVPIDPRFRKVRWTDWQGPPPNPDDYMPEWTPEEATHFMMYETTTEGTPISPAFETPEELAQWLANTNANAFAGEGASYGAWLRVVKGGYAPSAVLSPNRLRLVSGVEGFDDEG